MRISGRAKSSCLQVLPSGDVSLPLWRLHNIARSRTSPPSFQTTGGHRPTVKKHDFAHPNCWYVRSACSRRCACCAECGVCRNFGPLLFSLRAGNRGSRCRCYNALGVPNPVDVDGRWEVDSMTGVRASGRLFVVLLLWIDLDKDLHRLISRLSL